MSSHAPQLSSAAKSVLPTHVAVIMDGNGRWAKQRGLPRVEGHRHGAESVRAVVRAAGEVGIKFLTLYAFSVENWSRPKDEVDALMNYLARFLKTEIAEVQRSARGDRTDLSAPRVRAGTVEENNRGPLQKQWTDAHPGSELRGAH